MARVRGFGFGCVQEIPWAVVALNTPDHV